MSAGADLAAGCIASLDPLITMTKREPHLPMGLAPSRPDLFADKPGLHLVGLTWTCESDWLTGEIAADFARAAVTTIVIIEHDMRFLFRLADKVSVVHWGQVIAEGTPDALRENEWVRRSSLGTMQ